MINQATISRPNEFINPLFSKCLSIVTEREKEVLQLISFGKTNSQIARNLNLSASTVRNHISRIFNKQRISNRAQATAFAIRSGLVNLDSLGVSLLEEPDW